MYRPPEIVTSLRAARTLTDIGRTINANDHNRLAIALTQAACDNADHTGVPAVTRYQNDRRIRIEVGFVLDTLDRFIQNLFFDLFAFGIEQVQLRGDVPRLVWVVRRQKPSTEVRPADPSAGINSWSKNKARMEHTGRSFATSDIEQCL